MSTRGLQGLQKGARRDEHVCQHERLQVSPRDEPCSEPILANFEIVEEDPGEFGGGPE